MGKMTKNENKEVIDDKWFEMMLNTVCENCKYGVDYGDSVDYIYCERGTRKKRKHGVMKLGRCDKFEESK